MNTPIKKKKKRSKSKSESWSETKLSLQSSSVPVKSPTFTLSTSKNLIDPELVTQSSTPSVKSPTFTSSTSKRWIETELSSPQSSPPPVKRPLFMSSPPSKSVFGKFNIFTINSLAYEFKGATHMCHTSHFTNYCLFGLAEIFIISSNLLIKQFLCSFNDYTVVFSKMT